MDDGSLLAGYLTEHQLAEQLGETVRTQQRRRAERTGPAFTIIGRRVFYRREAVETWLRTREVKPPRGKRADVHALA